MTEPALYTQLPGRLNINMNRHDDMNILQTWYSDEALTTPLDLSDYTLTAFIKPNNSDDEEDLIEITIVPFTDFEDGKFTYTCSTDDIIDLPEGGHHYYLDTISPTGIHRRMQVGTINLREYD